MRRMDLDPHVHPRKSSESTKAALTLCQNPHALQDVMENLLEVTIGREVRARRKKNGMTIIDLARAAGLSLAMMSRIENGIISVSLTTLQALSRALGVPLTSLLKRFEEARDAVFLKAGTGVELERRGTRARHEYNLLGYIDSGPNEVSVEPYLVTLTEDTDRLPLFQHAGMEFLYMLEGEIIYRHGTRLYDLSQGDSLFFNAESPHGPNRLTKLPIRFLSIISYR